MSRISYSAIIAMILMAGQAHAWGDENWGESQPVIFKVDSKPDYLQQRIETRQRRFDVERAEQNRRLHVMHKNDRRILQKKGKGRANAVH